MTHEALLGELPKAATSFFVVFSRFEYTLKRAGYLRGNNKAQPDWNRLAGELGQDFLTRVRVSGEATTLLEQPPKKQVVRDGLLDWKTMPPIENANDLFLSVCCVRNNLFHGGKYGRGPLPEISRDEGLLREATRVLEMALDARPELHAIFNDPV
jgi:hypothetical protein